MTRDEARRITANIAQAAGVVGRTTSSGRVLRITRPPFVTTRWFTAGHVVTNRVWLRYVIQARRPRRAIPAYLCTHSVPEELRIAGLRCGGLRNRCAPKSHVATCLLWNRTLPR
jgi:hypothetical protein